MSRADLKHDRAALGEMACWAEAHQAETRRVLRLQPARRKSDAGTGNTLGSPARDFAGFYRLDRATLKFALLVTVLAGLLVMAGAWLDPSYLPSIPSIHGLGR